MIKHLFQVPFIIHHAVEKAQINFEKTSQNK